MIRRSAIATALILAIAALALPGSADARLQDRVGPSMAAVTFQLHVNGSITPRTTLWVAYGPLAGKFGIVPLHRASSGMYAATRILPLRGRTIFTFLAGRGSVHTRMGLVPGDPVTVIRRIGPTSADRLTSRAVEWIAPSG